MAKKNGADAKVFKSAVEKEYPHWLDGKEHNYIQIGGELDDQGVALMTIGLGHLLGVWEVFTPETIVPFLDDIIKQQMAARGMISFKANSLVTE